MEGVAHHSPFPKKNKKKKKKRMEMMGLGFATNVLAGAVCVLLAAIMFYAGMLYHDIMSYPPWHDQGNPLNLIIQGPNTRY